MGGPEPQEREGVSGTGGGVGCDGLKVRDEGEKDLNEDGAGRAHDGEEIGGDDEDVGEGGRVGSLGLGKVGGREEIGEGGDLCGAGGVEKIRAVEGERGRVGEEAGEGDMLDSVANERAADGAGRVEEGGVACGEGRLNEDREER